MCGIKSEKKNWQNNEDLITDDHGGDSVDSLAPSGGKAEYPPYGGVQSHPLWGWIFTYRAISL